MTPAVRISGLGKAYHLGQAADPHASFREAMTRGATALLRRGRGRAGAREMFWALKDVSFEVPRGQALGIIGANGAGKSTLLKILSRITEPSEGEAELHGRVASLLEVGAGFHPELTGRENVYLNGAILGMKKAEIERRFDEIVAFSEVERFLDTQVKRYSSGMYVRLAFAVAAHLQPEILIIDEVLAVGDAAFQKKCLGKMREVAAGEGRTVLFVSHNMTAVRTLCQAACRLAGGRLVQHGSAEECVAEYLRQFSDGQSQATVTLQRPAGASPWLKSATLLCDGQPATVLPMGGRLAIEVEFESEYALRAPALGFTICDEQGDRLINTNNRFQPSPAYESPVTSGRIRVDFGVVPFTGNRFYVTLWLGDRAHPVDTHVAENALCFDVREGDAWGQGLWPPRHYTPLWWPTRFEFGAAHA